MPKESTDCFPFIVCSSPYAISEQGAWDSFEKELIRQTGWIKGFHYWRRLPEYEIEKCFDTGNELHKVFARCYALKEENDNHIPIVIGEYNDMEIMDKMIALGFAKDEGAHNA